MFSQFKVRIPRPGRLDSFFLLVLVLNALAWLAERLAGWRVPGWELLKFSAYVAAFFLVLKLIRISIRTVLWRVRNRMIVLFLFIGLVPLLLVAGLIGLTGYVLSGQVAVYMATSELDRRVAQLRDAAAGLVWGLRAAEPSGRAGLTTTYLERAAQNWPGLQAVAWDLGRTAVFPPGASLETPQARLRDFRGIVRKEGRFYLLVDVSASSVPAPGEAAGKESVTVPRPAPPTAGDSGSRPGHKSRQPEVILLAPLSESYLAGLAPGLGRISFIVLSRDTAPLSVTGGSQKQGSPVRLNVGGESYTLDSTAMSTTESRTPLPPPANRFDYEIIWGAPPFRVEPWGDADRGAVSLRIQTRPAAVFRLLFGERMDLAYGVLVGFYVLETLFLMVELASLVIGVSITRTLTRSVHQLYEGTQKVNRGDFSHRIQPGGHDQLAELSRSFNVMTESI